MPSECGTGRKSLSGVKRLEQVVIAHGRPSGLLSHVIASCVAFVVMLFVDVILVSHGFLVVQFD